MQVLFGSSACSEIYTASTEIGWASTQFLPQGCFTETNCFTEMEPSPKILGMGCFIGTSGKPPGSQDQAVPSGLWVRPADGLELQLLKLSCLRYKIIKLLKNYSFIPRRKKSERWYPKAYGSLEGTPPTNNNNTRSLVNFVLKSILMLMDWFQLGRQFRILAATMHNFLKFLNLIFVKIKLKTIVQIRNWMNVILIGILGWWHKCLDRWN